MPATIDRAEFLRRMLGGAAAVGLVPLLACADDRPGPDAGPQPIDATPVDAPTDAPPDCLANGTFAGIALNHGHELEDTNAEIQAGTTTVYDIQGAADHTHSVTLLPEHYDALRLNQPVMVTSSSTGHTHLVTVSCG